MNTDYFERMYGMHWTDASDMLLEYYRKYKQEQPTYNVDEQRIDYSGDTSVTTIETTAVQTGADEGYGG